MQIDQAVPPAFRYGRHRRLKTFDIEVRPGDRFLEQAIEIRGDEPRPPLAVPAQRQQCLVSGGRVGRTKVRREDFRQLFPHLFASADDPVLQQVDGHVESFDLDGFLLFDVGCDTQIAIKLFDQSGEARQARRTGNTRAAEKHHTGVLVRLKQAVRNIGSILDELHRASLARRRHCLPVPQNPIPPVPLGGASKSETRL